LKTWDLYDSAGGTCEEKGKGNFLEKLKHGMAKKKEMISQQPKGD